MGELSDIRSFFVDNEKLIKRDFIFNLIKNITILILCAIIVFIPIFRYNPVRVFANNNKISVSRSTINSVLEVMDERWKDYEDDLERYDFDEDDEKLIKLLVSPFSTIDESFWQKIEKRFQQTLTSEQKKELATEYVDSLDKISMYKLFFDIDEEYSFVNTILLISFYTFCSIGVIGIGLSTLLIFKRKNIRYNYILYMRNKINKTAQPFKYAIYDMGLFGMLGSILYSVSSLLYCFIKRMMLTTMIILPLIIVAITVIAGLTLSRKSPLYVQLCEKTETDFFDDKKTTKNKKRKEKDDYNFFFDDEEK